MTSDKSKGPRGARGAGDTATDRRTLLRLAGGLGLAMALPAARACEFFSGQLTVVHPWTRASAPDATTAIVCMGFQDVMQSDRLVGAHSPIAEGATIAGLPGGEVGLGFTIPAGRSTAFTEDGVHLRLLGLKQPLKVARQYPLTLLFEKGGALPTQLTVDYARFS